jgi:hypothetical protein
MGKGLEAGYCVCFFSLRRAAGFPGCDFNAGNHFRKGLAKPVRVGKVKP